MNLTISQLCQIAPRSSPMAAAIVAALTPAMERFGINTERRAAHFLGQLAVESGEFTAKRENMNYSADGLANTWPARFAKKDAAGKYLLTIASADLGHAPTPGGRKVPNELALELHRQPEKIANVVYANRMGNGDAASGDGWRNRGAGWIQLTGADNLNACADFFDMPRDTVAAWLCTPTGAAMGAAWFWQRNNLNQHADVDDVDGVSDGVNLGRQTAKVGDAIGYNDRLMATQIAKRVLA